MREWRVDTIGVIARSEAAWQSHKERREDVIASAAQQSHK
jgi:hypothetical protein